MHDWFGTWLLFFPYTQLMSIFFRGVGLKPPTSSVHIKPIQIPAKCPANKSYGSPFTTRYRTKKTQPRGSSLHQFRKVVVAAFADDECKGASGLQWFSGLPLRGETYRDGEHPWFSQESLQMVDVPHLC